MSLQAPQCEGDFCDKRLSFWKRILPEDSREAHQEQWSAAAPGCVPTIYNAGEGACAPRSRVYLHFANLAAESQHDDSRKVGCDCNKLVSGRCPVELHRPFLDLARTLAHRTKTCPSQHLV